MVSSLRQLFLKNLHCRITIFMLPVVLMMVIANIETIYAQSDTSKANIADTIKKDLVTAPDTVAHLHSKTGSLIPPAVLLAYGTSSFFIHPVRQFDHYIYDQTDQHNFIIKSHVEDYFQYAPVILTYGLNLVGVHGKNTFIDRTILLAISEGIAGVTAYTLKKTTHRLRPDNSDYNSFPSGHTTNAFVEAEFMAQEFSGKSPLYGVAGYAFATTTGIFRIYHKDHWFSDVVAGAGLGILSTKAAYLIYPYIRNRISRSGREKEKQRDNEDIKKKLKTSSILIPGYQNGYATLRFAMEF